MLFLQNRKDKKYQYGTNAHRTTIAYTPDGTKCYFLFKYLAVFYEYCSSAHCLRTTVGQHINSY